MIKPMVQRCAGLIKEESISVLMGYARGCLKDKIEERESVDEALTDRHRLLLSSYL